MIEQYTSPAVVNNSQEPWLVGEGVSLSGSIAIPSLDFNFVTNAFPGTVTFTRASTATYFDSAGVLQSAAIDVPRLDYDPATLLPRGFLVEEQRTNSINNNTMQGAVAGTPGANPTNWSVSSIGSGVTREIVGTGTENGITYIDIKFSGTPIAGTNAQIAFTSSSAVAALSGQTWTNSVYVALANGSLSGVSLTLSSLETNGISGVIDNSKTIVPTTGALSGKRESLTATLSGGGIVTNIQPRVRIGYTVGVAFDITLRIGLPQLELGAFATSVIPTTTTALTRSADVAAVNTLSPWYNQSEGSVYTESAVFDSNAQTQAVWQIVGGSDSYSLRSPQGTVARIRALVGGTFSGIASGAAISDNTYIKAAVAWQGLSGRLQSGATGEDITAATTVAATQLNIGAIAGGGTLLNGWIKRLTYYPRRLSDAELQAITA